jgi:hypothetical protein
MGIVSRIDGAMEFAESLLKTNPKYLQANPQIGERVSKLLGQNREYLAHEYFNRDWDPMPFSEMVELLAPSKVDFACSANYLSHLDVANLTPDQIEFLSQIHDATFRESVRDFMLNTQFRQDYWVKAVRSMPYYDRIETLKSEMVMLTISSSDIPFRIDCPLGTADLSEKNYSAIIETLSNHEACSVGDILSATELKGITLALIVESIMTLVHVMTVQQPVVSTSAVESSERLNQHLMQLARNSDSGHGSLASPLTGGGIQVPRLEQLYLLAVQSGHNSAKDVAKFTWQFLEDQGEKVIKDGESLETSQENLDYLSIKAGEFIEKRLAILIALQVVPVNK